MVKAVYKEDYFKNSTYSYSNMNKLAQIANLEAGWDRGNADVFSDELILKVRNIIINLQYQPELFPTACNTIQIEYEKDNGAYLEIEIADADDAKIFSIDEKGYEAVAVIPANAQEISKVVNAFMDDKFLLIQNSLTEI